MIIVATTLIAVAFVLAFLFAEKLRGPHPSTGRVIGTALAGLGISVAAWMLIGGLIAAPTDTAIIVLGVMLGVFTAVSALRGKQRATAPLA